MMIIFAATPGTDEYAWPAASRSAAGFSRRLVSRGKLQYAHDFGITTSRHTSMPRLMRYR